MDFRVNVYSIPKGKKFHFKRFLSLAKIVRTLMRAAEGRSFFLNPVTIITGRLKLLVPCLSSLLEPYSYFYVNQFPWFHKLHFPTHREKVTGRGREKRARSVQGPPPMAV